MELLERSHQLDVLRLLYEKSAVGVGHTVLIKGEAGIGKTSLVEVFVREVGGKSLVLSGICDALFTPRPLGPLYDIASKFDGKFAEMLKSTVDRNLIFSNFLKRLEHSTLPVLLIFEDVHWADEATLDLIKFVARRITTIKGLFIITYRDDEVHQGHPLRSVLGDLPSGKYSKVSLQRLSVKAVEALARDTKYEGKAVYDISGGNPFFVTEILAEYSKGIPENIKDSVLATFNAQEVPVKELWEFLSILPNRTDISLLNIFGAEYLQIIDSGIGSGVIKMVGQDIYFKHELYRNIIAESLSPIKKKMLHQKMLGLLLEHSENITELSIVVHHAIHAENRKVIAEYAPLAARHAASVGAHIEASVLYGKALEFCEYEEREMVRIYQQHAYECYLTNQINEAIKSQEKVLQLWRSIKNPLKEGDASRFLSRLWWFNGNKEKSQIFGREAIKVLENGFPTRERALAYSNYAQLCMLADDYEQTIFWGNKAKGLAEKLQDRETLSHALNNIGVVQMKKEGAFNTGLENLQKSLEIALANGYHEHAARAYTNIGSICEEIKQFDRAGKALKDGIAYCEERDLDSWTYYMKSRKGSLGLVLGKWDEAEEITFNLLSYHHPPPIKIGALLVSGIIKMRRGSVKEASQCLAEALKLARPINETQRLLPVAIAYLEFYWLFHNCEIPSELSTLIEQLHHMHLSGWYKGELYYWLKKCGLTIPSDKNEIPEIYRFELDGKYKKAIHGWEQLGCPYELALSYFETDDEGKKKALQILDSLKAEAVVEMLKQKMRKLGIKSIPRGQRESTRKNPAQLTTRQVEVLHLLKDGMNNNEIANTLFVSPKTVDHHVSAILSKLYVNSRTKAVIEARKLGILK